MYGRWLPNMCTHISFKTHTRQQELLSTWLVPCQRLDVGGFVYKCVLLGLEATVFASHQGSYKPYISPTGRR